MLCDQCGTWTASTATSCPSCGRQVTHDDLEADHTQLPSSLDDDRSGRLSRPSSAESAGMSLVDVDDDEFATRLIPPPPPGVAHRPDHGDDGATSYTPAGPITPGFPV